MFFCKWRICVFLSASDLRWRKSEKKEVKGQIVGGGGEKVAICRCQKGWQIDLRWNHHNCFLEHSISGNLAQKSPPVVVAIYAIYAIYSAISSVWGERGKVLRFNFNSMRPYIDINSDTLRAVSGRLGYAAPFPRSTLNRAKAQMGQGAEERKKVGEINLFACHVNFPAFFSSDSKLNLWNSNWSFQSFYITFLSLRAWPLLASERAQFIFLYGLSVLRGESI